MKVPSHDEIRARAYEIFLERGGEHGHDLEDWAAAEQEMSGRREITEAVYKQDEPEVDTRKSIKVAAGASRAA